MYILAMKSYCWAHLKFSTLGCMEHLHLIVWVFRFFIWFSIHDRSKPRSNLNVDTRWLGAHHDLFLDNFSRLSSPGLKSHINFTHIFPAMSWCPSDTAQTRV